MSVFGKQIRDERRGAPQEAHCLERGDPGEKLAAQKRDRMTRWLIVVEGDVDPRLEGPFISEQARLAAAQSYRKSDAERQDGLYRLDVSAAGRPRVRHFTAGEIDDLH
jgi:hypothetical protein